MNLLSLDTETTGLNPRTAKVIGFSYSDGKLTNYISHLVWTGNELVEHYSFDECVGILNRIKVNKLIMHNAAYDVQVVKNYFGVDLTDSLHADTMIMAHSIDENHMQYGLKYLGEKLLNIKATEQQDLHEDLKSKNTKDFYKADSNILAKYAKQDALLTYKLYTHLETKCPKLFYNELMPLLKTVTIPMMQRGVAINVTELQKDLNSITLDIEKLETNIQKSISPHLTEFKQWFYDKNYPLKSRGRIATLIKQFGDLKTAQLMAFKQDGGTYEFNLSSKDHLRRLFFDKLKCKPLGLTNSGLPQFDNDFLEHVDFDFAKELIVYNKLQKIKSTYIERFLQEQENGVFYPMYFMHRTVSGRLSGDMQQLPRPIESGHELVKNYTNKIREYFIARPNCVFIDNDYNSLEPRVFAAVAGDEALKDIFKQGHDFYSTIAIMVEGLDASADKKATNYLGKINKEARQKAKAYSLGIAYGLDDYKLHKDLNIDQKLARELVQNYFKAFPKLAQWQQNTREQILNTGKIATRFDRVRNAPQVPKMYEKHGNAILNALELWKKYNGEEPDEIKYKNAKKDYKEVRHAINNAYNHQIQGLSAHILNRASIAIAKIFRELNMQSIIVASIHDQLVIESPESERDEAARIVQNLMENTTIIETPLEAIPSFGYNLRDSH